LATLSTTTTTTKDYFLLALDFSDFLENCFNCLWNQKLVWDTAAL